MPNLNKENMDYQHYLNEAKSILNNHDPVSIKLALVNLKKANQMIDNSHLKKYEILYYLATCNALIGNATLAYRISYRIERLILEGIENGTISMRNMHHIVPQDHLDDLREQIRNKYPQYVMYVNTEDDNFDENELDFRIADVLISARNRNVFPKFSIDSLTDDVIMATFFGFGRDDQEYIYFDKLHGDVLGYFQGYLLSIVGEQGITNREKLAKNITSNEPIDFIDVDRYILIERLHLPDFLVEFRRQSSGREPFSSCLDYFSVEVVKGFGKNENISIEELAFSWHVLGVFQDIFCKKHQARIDMLQDDFELILGSTCKSLAIEWIRRNVFV